MTERLDVRRDRIERSLERALSTPHADAEFEAIRHQWPSGYVRGQLFLALTDAVAADVGDRYPVAVSLELSYLQALVHGRVLEGIAGTEPTSRVDDRAILSGDFLQARAFEQLGRFDAPPSLVSRCFSVLTQASLRVHEGQFERHQFVGEPAADPTTGPATPNGSVIRFGRTAPAVLGGAAARLAGVVGDLERGTLDRLEEHGAAFGWTLAAESIPDCTAVAHPRESIDSIVDGLVDCCPDAGSADLYRRLSRFASRTREECERAKPGGSYL